MQTRGGKKSLLLSTLLIQATCNVKHHSLTVNEARLEQLKSCLLSAGNKYKQQHQTRLMYLWARTQELLLL